MEQLKWKSISADWHANAKTCQMAMGVSDKYRIIRTGKLSHGLFINSKHVPMMFYSYAGAKAYCHIREERNYYRNIWRVRNEKNIRTNTSTS